MVLAERGNQFWPPATDHWPLPGSRSTCEPEAQRGRLVAGLCSLRCLVFSNCAYRAAARSAIIPELQRFAPQEVTTREGNCAIPPHNGLCDAHNVSIDAVMGCGDVFTTAKYRRPGVGRTIPRRPS